MANLSPEQLQQVESWAEAGANLNDIQSRLKSDFGISLTYLDARMLMIETGVRLKEKAKEVFKPSPEAEPAPAPAPAPTTAEDWSASDSGGTGGVSVTADATPAPGAIASGRATFSDGQSAIWYVDQNGQLGIKAPTPGYQPPQNDIPIFEQQLDVLLQGL